MHIEKTRRSFEAGLLCNSNETVHTNKERRRNHAKN